LSVIVIAAERELATKGVNVTPIVQKPFTAIAAGLIGQLFVCAKSPGFVPVTAMLPIARGLGPLFVTVIVCMPLVVFKIWLGKLTEDGAGVTVGGAGNPVPLKPTESGLLLPLSVIVIAAARALATEGVNVTLIVQKAFAAIVEGLIGQLFVCAKSPEFVPVTAMLPIASGPGPLFVTVIACAPLVVFRIWFGKMTVEGDGNTEAPFPLANPVTAVKKVPGWL
jgi:hypothetical protein